MKKMKFIQLLILFFVPGLLFACNDNVPEVNNETPEQTGKTYLINTQEDFDKWSNFNFPAGSKVLFAAGKTFKGQFILRGNGSETAPNLAAACDPESGAVITEWTDQKPVIHGEGKVNSALLLRNGGFWEINNIEVTNTNGSKIDQGKLLGINVIAENFGVVHNVTIKNCYVHDVNGNVGGKETGGIHVYVLGKSVKTKFNNLTIENNRIFNIGGVGIANQSSWGGITSSEYDPWTNFAIRGNRVEHTGRNGIIVRYARDAVVEYNKLVDNSRYDSGHSVFNFNTINCVMQYNEAYGNTSDDPNEIDHGGFDADYNSKGTVIQYNYSHDNNWFCGIMRKAVNTDITIRYNISQNERLGVFFYGFANEQGVKDVKIYNNTFYFGKGKGKQVFAGESQPRVPTETTFSNNIFYFEDQAEWGIQPDATCVFENNLFFNVSPKGENTLTADPLFVDPGSGGTDIDMKDPNRLSGYKLKEGSPAIDGGKIMGGYAGSDFTGNPVTGQPDLGALESGAN